MTEQDDPLEAVYEGAWSRLACQGCGNVFDVEDDVSNGEVFECDCCGESCAVTGR